MSEIYNVNALPSGAMLQEYRLVRVIGAGSFGIIYLAQNTYLPQTVAIKEFLPNDLAQRVEGTTVAPKSSGTEESYHWALGKFLKEARIIWELGQPNRHPNIVRVIRFFEENGTAYMVMDFEEGASLAQRLDDGTIPEEELRELLFRLLDGLQRVHERSVWHRDIKPANILIRADGTPVLIDFGAARHEVGEQAASIMDVYTPDYAAPEQVYSNDDIGPWTDIYALGATLYRAVTGKPPTAATQRALGAEHVLAVEAAASDYSNRFLDAIDAAIELKVENRPQSVEEWRQRFERKVEPIADVGGDQTVIRPQRGVASKAPSALTRDDGRSPLQHANLEDAVRPRHTRAEVGERRDREPRRRGGLVAALSVLTVLALGGGGTVYWMNSQPTPVAEGVPAPATEALANATETKAPQREPLTATEPVSADALTVSLIDALSPTGAEGTASGATPPKAGDLPPARADEVEVSETARVPTPSSEAAKMTLATTLTATSPRASPPLETPRDEVAEVIRQLTPPAAPEQLAAAPEQLTFTQPAPLNPERTLQQAQQLIREAECAALRVDLTDDSQILLSGYARSRSELVGLINQLALLDNVNGVLQKVRIHGRPFCEVLQILNADASLDAGVGAPLRIEPDKASRVYFEGELLRLTAQPTREFDGYLYVDYIDGEGNVLHLLPTPRRPENWIVAGETVLLGQDRKYEIAPPHGESMIIAILTRARLFSAARPEIESITDYLPVLRGRLREVERSGNSAGIASSYTVIKTRAQGAAREDPKGSSEEAT